MSDYGTQHNNGHHQHKFVYNPSALLLSTVSQKSGSASGGCVCSVLRGGVRGG